MPATSGWSSWTSWLRCLVMLMPFPSRRRCLWRTSHNTSRSCVTLASSNRNARGPRCSTTWRTKESCGCGLPYARWLNHAWPKWSASPGTTQWRRPLGRCCPGTSYQSRCKETRFPSWDVRPALEYQHGHLPGAVSLPVDQLSIRLDELPRDRPIVTYCRGSFCLFADEAVAMLRRHGFDAYRLESGWPEW